MTDKVYIGYDPRQPVSLHILASSILRRASRPISITALVLEQLPIKRQGLTPFTFSRFLVPYLCDFDGWGVFLDADELVTGDICQLFDHPFDSGKAHAAVYVRKDLPPKLQFERASVMLFNCGHPANKVLTPEFIEKADGLHRCAWLSEDLIGNIPPEWNHLVGYEQPPEQTPKLLHYTQGVPIWPETQGGDYAQEWLDEANFATSAVPWKELMGTSVHAKPVYERLARQREERALKAIAERSAANGAISTDA